MGPTQAEVLTLCLGLFAPTLCLDLFVHTYIYIYIYIYAPRDVD